MPRPALSASSVTHLRPFGCYVDLCGTPWRLSVAIFAAGGSKWQPRVPNLDSSSIKAEAKISAEINAEQKQEIIKNHPNKMINKNSSFAKGRFRKKEILRGVFTTNECSPSRTSTKHASKIHTK